MKRPDNQGLLDGVNNSGTTQGVNFNGSAENTLAQIYRAEWQDYLDRFAPYEDKLIDYAMNPGEVTEAVDRAGENVDQGFMNAQGNLNRDRSRYGLSLNGREAANEERNTAIDKTAAKLAARNSTRLHVQDQQERVMSGGSAVGLREQIGSGGN